MFWIALISILLIVGVDAIAGNAASGFMALLLGVLFGIGLIVHIAELEVKSKLVKQPRRRKR